jgi:hypothetical protein
LIFLQIDLQIIICHHYLILTTIHFQIYQTLEVIIGEESIAMNLIIIFIQGANNILAINLLIMIAMVFMVPIKKENFTKIYFAKKVKD